MTLYRETPCEHGLLNEHDWYTSKPLQTDSALVGYFPGLCPGGSREEVTIDFGDMAEVPVSKIRKALDTYDWRLTEHQEIRMMAHAAEKFLIMDAAINPLETSV